eukprot:4271592-Alexandrium_andersonii.AAC.1
MACWWSASEVKATSLASGYDDWPNTRASTPLRVSLSFGSPVMPERMPLSKTSATPLPGAKEVAKARARVGAVISARADKAGPEAVPPLALAPVGALRG